MRGAFQKPRGLDQSKFWSSTKFGWTSAIVKTRFVSLKELGVSPNADELNLIAVIFVDDD